MNRVILCPAIVKPTSSEIASGDKGATMEETGEQASGIELIRKDEIATIEQAIASSQSYDAGGTFSKTPFACEPCEGQEAQNPFKLRCPGTPSADQ